jgi:hypothetical protein
MSQMRTNGLQLLKFPYGVGVGGGIVLGLVCRLG